MESLDTEEGNIIKDIRNLFRLKKEQNYIAVNDTRNLFRLKKEIKGIKDTVLRYIKNLFEYGKKEENCYKSVTVNDFWSYNYIEYKNSGYKNITTSVEEYINKIRPYVLKRYHK